MKNWLIAAIGTAIILPLTGCSMKPDIFMMTVSTKVAKESFANYIKIDGTVESKEKIAHVSTDLTDLKVIEINCETGDRVKKGDVLCRLDTSELEDELNKLESDKTQSDTLLEYKYEQCLEKIKRVENENDARLEKAQAAIDKAQDDYNDASYKYDENNDLYEQYTSNANEYYANAQNTADKEEAASIMEEYSSYLEMAGNALAEREQASANMKLYDNEIAVARDAYKEAELTNEQLLAEAQNEADICRLTGGDSGETVSRIANIKKTIENSEIKASCDGVITSVFAVVGTTCSNGILMEIQDCSNLCIHVVVKEEDFLEVKKNMEAQITVASNADKNYMGVVENIIDIKSDEGFDGFITIDDPDESFVLGMSANVKICTDSRTDVLTIDKSAIFTNSEDQLCVYKGEADSDGKYIAHETVIETGLQNDEVSEITSGDIKEDDIVILDISKCSDGYTFIPEFIDEVEDDE